ncbi:MAG: myo-inositol-1(or 4)-monophosphatase [Flavobacteriaceae bacterium]|jgi:myo-inositol-1(or 4)-monophosphatase
MIQIEDISLKDIEKIICSTKTFFNSPVSSIEQKNDTSYVTECDKNIESFLIEKLTVLFPSIPFLSEETNADTNIEKGFAWCIDPIDGTHNFIQGIPFFCVSVGLLYNGESVLGCVYDPMRNELFSAKKGEGFFFQGEVYDNNIKYQKEYYMFSTARAQNRYMDENEVCRKLQTSKKQYKYRRFCSCALELAYVAIGRLDALFILGNSHWDYAAAECILKEAGGIKETLSDSDYLCTYNQSIKDDIIKLL